MTSNGTVAGGGPPCEPPLVSVVVPAWNAERTLMETLESVAAQTHCNLEIIIVDDGSTDGTAAVAAQFCEAEPRARLVRKENGGVASARNRGIEESRAEWIAPIDADDLWHPTKIEKQLAAALSAPEPPGFVYCWFQHMDERGDVTGSGPRVAVNGGALNQLAYSNFVQNGSALLLCRRAVLAVGGYDSSLRARGGEGCEDLMIQLQIARRFPIAAVSEHLVGYRCHPRAMSRDFDQMVRSWELVYQQLREERAVQPQVIRWTMGLCYLGLAEARAVSRDYAASLRLLADALRLDPVRCGSQLFYRLSRTAVRIVRGRRDPPGRVSYNELDPATCIPKDPDEIRSLSQALAALDARRLRALAALDVQP